MALSHRDWSKVATTAALHLLFWVLIVTYFAWGVGIDVNPKRAFMTALFFLPGQVIMVYCLLYFLVPKYLLQRKLWHFLIGFLILVLVCASYASVANLFARSVEQFREVTISLTSGRKVLPFVHVAAIAASIKLLKYFFLQRKRTVEAEQQRAVAELKLLKAQLHPHFLFNTLNNLYSHTLEFSPKSPEIVLKLSALLRFMIYESNTPKISLSKEVELLQNYITLEQLRYGGRLDVSISITGDIEKYQIAPLLLLPFLENAFKHGTSKQIDQCWISLNLAMEGNFMRYKLLNSIDKNYDEGQLKSGGIGLNNVIRRLQLLYKDKFHLETDKMNEVFMVNLEVTLETLEEQYVDKLQSNYKQVIYGG